MRTISAGFKTRKNASSCKPIFLYTIVDINGTDDMCITSHDTDITYDSIVYSKFPITHEPTTESSTGEIDTVKVSVGNASRLIEAYLVTYELRGKQVKIKTVFADALDDADAYIEDIFYIDSYTATEDRVDFTLTSKFDVLGVTLPLRNYLRNTCQWKFKGTECAYAGAESTCNKTLSLCRTYANQLRFGGFPSIPSDRVYAG